MRSSPWFLLLALAGAGGCGEPPRKTASLQQTIPNIPIPPDAQFLDRAGGEDALQLQFRSAQPPEQVAKYYRGVFSRPPWRLISDARTGDGGFALYAEQGGPPIWVTIQRAAGTAGSLVNLAGAVVPKEAQDSAKGT